MIYVLSKNRKNNVYLCKPQFYYIKVGFKWVKIIQVCLHDVKMVSAKLAQRMAKVKGNGHIFRVCSSVKVDFASLQKMSLFKRKEFATIGSKF